MNTVGEIVALRADPDALAVEYADLCHELGCIVKLGVALKFAKELRDRLTRAYIRENELIRMWDRASPTERQELDRMRRGWGPSSPTERERRRADVAACVQALSIAASDLTVGEDDDVPEEARDRLDEAYERVSKAEAAAREVLCVISADPKDWPDIVAAEERGAEAAQAEIARLRKALDPFACAAEFYEVSSEPDEDTQILVRRGTGFAAALTVRDFRRAQRVIQGGQP